MPKPWEASHLAEILSWFCITGITYLTVLRTHAGIHFRTHASTLRQAYNSTLLVGMRVGRPESTSPSSVLSRIPAPASFPDNNSSRANVILRTRMDFACSSWPPLVRRVMIGRGTSCWKARRASARSQPPTVSSHVGIRSASSMSGCEKSGVTGSGSVSEPSGL
jgi:hypothetical protein